MSKCFKCGLPGHKKSECPSSTIECYDCHLQVTDIKAHRMVCTKSRHQKSSMTSSYNSSTSTPNTSTSTTSTSTTPTTSTSSLKANNVDYYYIFDVSGSMEGAKLESAKKCALNIVEKMSKTDRIAIITFDSSAFFKLKPRVVEQIIRQNELPPLLDRIFARGLTALYDAIHLAITQIRDKNQKTILNVLTDGEDNSSKHSYKEVLDLLKEFPHLSLNIIHIDGKLNPNTNYATLCSSNSGQYVSIDSTEIEKTVIEMYTVSYTKITST